MTDLMTFTALPVLTAPPEPDFRPEAAVYFLKSGDYLFTDYAGGGKRSKFVTALDLKAAWSQTEQDTGWIPAGVVRVGSNASGPWFVYSTPAQKIELTLLDPEARITIPLPRLVMVGVNRQYFIWALHAKHFEPNLNAYHAPFPNIHEDGRICWGSNTPPEINPENARAAWDLFFSTPFNSHLAGRRSKAFPDVRAQLRSLSEKKANTYPAGDLLPTHESIGRLVKRVTGAK